MLRTNTKKAKQSIHNYIIENFHPEEYAENFGTISEGASFAEVARYIVLTYLIYKDLKGAEKLCA